LVRYADPDETSRHTATSTGAVATLAAMGRSFRLLNTMAPEGG
jgi:hypothetical protein